jgi:hypothetical protein
VPACLFRRKSVHTHAPQASAAPCSAPRSTDPASTYRHTPFSPETFSDFVPPWRDAVVPLAVDRHERQRTPTVREQETMPETTSQPGNGATCPRHLSSSSPRALDADARGEPLRDSCCTAPVTPRAGAWFGLRARLQLGTVAPRQGWESAVLFAAGMCPAALRSGLVRFFGWLHVRRRQLNQNSGVGRKA